MRATVAAAIILALALTLIASFDTPDTVAAQTDCVQPLTYEMLDSDGSFVDIWIDEEATDCPSVHRPADEDAPGDGIYRARYYTFSLSEASDVAITLESPIDTYLYLLQGAGMDGAVLYKNDDIDLAARNFNSRIHATLDFGDYTIEATTYDAVYPTPVVEFRLTVSGITPQPTADDDRAALTALYHATDGDNWRNNTNWLTDAPLQEWYGVYNTDSDGRVTNLQIHGNSLSGQIHSKLGDLEKLRVLALGSNQLTGTVPPELGKLVNLEYLGISRNRLSGELPRSLTQLTMLSEFFFEDNTGLCAPNTDDAFMAWLRDISKADGATCDPLPPADVHDTDGLKALYDATNGDNWHRNDNWLTDAPLSEWYGVTIDFDGRVSELNLNHNGLNGELPSALGNLTNLKALNLRVNRITGRIPSQLGETH